MCVNTQQAQGKPDQYGNAMPRNGPNNNQLSYAGGNPNFNESSPGIQTNNGVTAPQPVGNDQIQIGYAGGNPNFDESAPPIQTDGSTPVNVQTEQANQLRSGGWQRRQPQNGAVGNQPQPTGPTAPAAPAPAPVAPAPVAPAPAAPAPAAPAPQPAQQPAPLGNQMTYDQAVQAGILRQTNTPQSNPSSAEALKARYPDIYGGNTQKERPETNARHAQLVAQRQEMANEKARQKAIREGRIGFGDDLPVDNTGPVQGKGQTGGQSQKNPTGKNVNDPKDAKWNTNSSGQKYRDMPDGSRQVVTVTPMGEQVHTITAEQRRRGIGA